MSIADNLTVSEKEQYEVRHAQIYKFPVAEEKNRDSLMKQFLAEKDLSYAVKCVLISKLFRLPSATAWAYQNLQEETTLLLLSQIQPINMRTAHLAARNKHFTWNIVKHMLVTNTMTNPKAMDVFIAQLNEEVVTQEFAANLMLVKNFARILNPDIITKRVREAYEIDPTIPDSWVEEMFKVKEKVTTNA